MTQHNGLLFHKVGNSNSTNLQNLRNLQPSRLCQWESIIQKQVLVALHVSLFASVADAETVWLEQMYCFLDEQGRGSIPHLVARMDGYLERSFMFWDDSTGGSLSCDGFTCTGKQFDGEEVTIRLPSQSEVSEGNHKFIPDRGIAEIQTSSPTKNGEKPKLENRVFDYRCSRIPSYHDDGDITLPARVVGFLASNAMKSESWLRGCKEREVFLRGDLNACEAKK